MLILKKIWPTVKNVMPLFFLIVYGTFARAHSESVSTAAGKILVDQFIYGFNFERLDSFSKFSASSLKGQKSIWVLFEPNCRSCERQFKDLGCIKSATNLAIGFLGKKENLNQMMRKSGFSGEKLQASSQFEKLVGLKQTPTILIVDAQGVVKKQFFSYIPCESLKKELDLFP